MYIAFDCRNTSVKCVVVPDSTIKFIEKLKFTHFQISFYFCRKLHRTHFGADKDSITLIKELTLRAKSAISKPSSSTWESSRGNHSEGGLRLYGGLQQKTAGRLHEHKHNL